MASRRMFDIEFCQSDDFLDLSFNAQALYFQLNLVADDDGFITKAKSIIRMTGNNQDAFDELKAHEMIYVFDTGVVLIKHWKVHNFIRADRYKKTKKEEINQVEIDENTHIYTWLTNGIPTDNQVTTKCQPSDNLGKDRLGKDRLGKVSIGKDSIYTGKYNNVQLKNEEYLKLVEKHGVDKTHQYIDYLDNAIKEHNYNIKNFYSQFDKWVIDAVENNNEPITNNPFLRGLVEND